MSVVFLSDLDSVDAFVDGLKADAVDIDAFVNNAGAFRHPDEKTKQGFDLVLGVNYLGVYRLSEKLLLGRRLGRVKSIDGCDPRAQHGELQLDVYLYPGSGVLCLLDRNP